MLVEAEVWTVARTDQGNAVLVRPKEMKVAVPIFIAQLETQSILIGLGKVPMPRPLTHDLLISILQHLGVILERVEITDLKDGTFYAQLAIVFNGREQNIDARPSDAIALAVRIKCPIYIAESVIDEASIPIELINENPAAQESASLDVEIEKLQAELAKAVEEENYEEAARLRDRINEITGTS